MPKSAARVGDRSVAEPGEFSWIPGVRINTTTPPTGARSFPGRALSVGGLFMTE